ncbi:MAG TPA: aldehyde dehydrogenase family protein [Ilumatobacter sp.]|nr:aldehyde dehydrogenase family protein [Ilumatobacter sp.]
MNAVLEQVAAVRKGFAAGALTEVTARRTQLERVRAMLTDHEADLADALHTDLGKSATEARVTETGFLLNEIDHTLKHLDKWTRPEKVRLPLHLGPGKAHVVPEPLGTVLIIAPWNYPLQLTLAPLIPALAAGNTVVLKPSEVAPATSAAIARFVGEYLDPSVVRVVEGGVDETTVLLAEPWDHIFYTGNGTVGRVVLRAAAEHLTPATLELGGKSPAIVTDSANVGVSARRIAWGKFTNAGQTCIAPDYVLVDERVAPAFVDALVAETRKMYGSDPASSADYGRVVNERHVTRLQALLDGGGYDSVATGGTVDAANRYIAPTVLTGVDPQAPVMDDEIFGPILPVLTYSHGVTEAIEFVNARPKPLALYAFTADTAVADRVVAETSAGGVTVNHALMHVAVPDLPFGGVGPSGMGAYHGKAGFDVFSHRKPVLRRRFRPDPSLAYPPYTALKQRVLKRLF